jgi:divalent metal cation (Fe/Co/Zn/Cd) transporter
MTVEVLGSIGIGLIAGSFALLAFGGDSFIELLSGIVVLRHLRAGAGRSTSESHRTELATALLLAALVPIIGVGAAYSYIVGLRPEGSSLGILIAVGAVIIMPYLWYEKKTIGSETGSLPLTVDAIESVTCILMAVALLGGLLSELFFGLWWADYLATAFILAFVAREALESFREIGEREG